MSPKPNISQIDQILPKICTIYILSIVHPLLLCIPHGNSVLICVYVVLSTPFGYWGIFFIAIYKLYLFYSSDNAFYKMYCKFWRNLNISINIEIYTIFKMWKKAFHMHDYTLRTLLINTLSALTYWSNLTSNCSHELSVIFVGYCSFIVQPVHWSNQRLVSTAWKESIYEYSSISQ